MITIKLQDNGYAITGHAGYAEHGKDIICAAVSALNGSLIKWLESANIDYVYSDDGKMVALVLDESARMCYDMVVTGFMTLAKEYPEYVRVV